MSRVFEQVFISNYGTFPVSDKVLAAYGVLTEPKSRDGRRKEVKEYRRSLALFNRNMNAIASHCWIMEKDVLL